MTGHCAGVVNPASEGEDTIIFTLNQEPVTGQGARSQSVFGLNINEAWDVSEARLILQMRFSEIIDWTRSSLMISVNGIPLTSVQANSFTGEQTISIDVPVSMLGKYTEIEVASYFRYSHDICEDLQNPNLWFVLEGGSALHLTYSLKKGGQWQDLRSFPLPLVDSFHPQPFRGGTIVIPDEPGEETITALLRLMALWSVEGTEEAFVPIKRAGQVSAHDQWGNLIILGLLCEFEPHWLQQIYGDHEERIRNRAQQGLLSTVSWPGHSWFYMLATEGEGLYTILKALSLEEYREHFMGHEAEFTRLQLPEEQRPNRNYSPDGSIDLQTLGYGTVVLQGMAPSVRDLFIPLPVHWEIRDEILVRLHIRYAGNVSRDQSYLTIWINQKPWQTIPLSDQGLEDREIIVRVPGNLVDPWGFSLGLQYSMYGDLDICYRTQEDRAWVRIEGSSSIHLPYEEQEEYYIRQFVDRTIRYGQDPIFMVFAGEAEDIPLQMACQLLLSAWPRSGDYERIQAVFMDIHKADRLSQNRLGDGHVVFVGSGQRLESVPELWHSAGLGINPLGMLTGIRQDFVDAFLAEALIATYTPSPFNEDLSALILTYNPFFSFTEEQRQALSFGKIPHGARGDTAFIGAQGTLMDVFTHSPIPSIEKEAPTVLMPVQRRSGIIVLSAGLLVLLILFFIAHLYYGGFREGGKTKNEAKT